MTSGKMSYTNHLPFCDFEKLIKVIQAAPSGTHRRICWDQLHRCNSLRRSVNCLCFHHLYVDTGSTQLWNVSASWHNTFLTPFIEESDTLGSSAQMFLFVMFKLSDQVLNSLDILCSDVLGCMLSVRCKLVFTHPLIRKNKQTILLVKNTQSHTANCMYLLYWASSIICMNL